MFKKRVMPQQPFFMLVGMLFTLLLSACQLVQLPAPEQDAAAVTALRPDMPSYAKRGQFDVGYRSLVSDGETARSLDVHLWYPALNPAGAVAEIAYEFTLKDPEWRTNGPAIVNGHALRDASVNDTEGPYPLVIFSHGFNTNAAWYSTLLEQYASQGFIVLAPEHVEQDWMESAPATIDRPLDITQVLDYAEELTGQGGELAGLIDMANVAVVGHSFGGYTVLAMAGAQMDMQSLNQSCAELSPEDQPKQFLCKPFLGMDAAMAAHAGLDAVPTDLWPSLGDSRVTAIVSIAGDAFLFDQVGLSKITIPMMAIGGMADTVTPYDWGSKLSYDYVSSEQKVLVGFQGAEHMFIFTPCAQMPWIAEFPFRDYICFDPVWDKQRGLDLVHHFSIAFLLDTLKGDQAAHEMLLPDAVQFPGIEYRATLR